MLASACSAGPAELARPSVVASAYPLAWVVERLGGESVTVTDLTPPGAEPHDVELTRSAVDAIHDASLVVYVKGGFQPAVEAAIRSADGPLRVDVLGGAKDPHVWLSPERMRGVVAQVATAMSKLSPTVAKAVATRRQGLDAELAELDAAYRRGLEACRSRNFVTTHAAFGYLAENYRLHQVAVAGLSPEVEPSPRRLAEVADLARRDGATTIFYEDRASPRVAEAVAREAGGLRTAVLSPIETRSPGADYLALMGQNLEALREALGCA